MKINDILCEAGDDSGDYQQMLAFTRANRVGGVPDEQQIPLALFKELKKQQQQNQTLGAELDAAEQRIDQATASGELSRQELGMHRTELDREVVRYDAGCTIPQPFVEAHNRAAEAPPK